MIRRLTPLAAAAITVAAFAGCTNGRDAEPSTTTVNATTPPPSAATAAVSTAEGITSAASTSSAPSLITAPTITAPVPIQERPDTTVRVGVFAEGGDGLGDDDGTVRYPAFDAFDITPLPAAITDEQGRTDPAAVARQWAGLKVLTSQIMDGPLWPYSVGRHLPALSDPTGQFIADGRLHDVEVVEQWQPDTHTAYVTVAVDADNPSGETLHIVYDIELWRSDDGYWLVAFADLAAGQAPR